MADAGRTATKAKTASRKTGASGRSPGAASPRGRTSGTTSTARKPGKASTAGKSRSKTSRSRTSGSTAAKKTGGGKSGATTTVRRPAARTGAGNGNGVNVPVPVLTPHMKTLHVPTPGMTYVEDAGRIVAGYLPSPERMAFYGGLGIAAVIGAIDWPVATAIGIGTMIARKTGRGRGARSRAGRPQASVAR